MDLFKRVKRYWEPPPLFPHGFCPHVCIFLLVYFGCVFLAVLTFYIVPQIYRKMKDEPRQCKAPDPSKCQGILHTGNDRRYPCTQHLEACLWDTENMTKGCKQVKSCRSCSQEPIPTASQTNNTKHKKDTLNGHYRKQQVHYLKPDEHEILSHLYCNYDPCKFTKTEWTVDLQGYSPDEKQLKRRRNFRVGFS